MRAATGGRHEKGGRHVSGAERLVPESEVEAASLELLRRARGHAAADFIQLSVEAVPACEVAYAPCLPLIARTAADPTESRREAQALLASASILPEAISEAFRLVTEGHQGEPIRGAVLLEGTERREPDFQRGVRATRMDFAPGVRDRLQRELQEQGLSHFRTLEALAVATKVLWCGVAAELCWSDDEGYAAGYVAIPSLGYVRFPHFKPAGAVGGRVFFITPGTDTRELIHRLEKSALLIKDRATVL